MNKFYNIFEDFISMFFPNICQGCEQPLTGKEKYICLKCLYTLPKTNFHNSRKNIISELFFGKINFENATSFCFFNKDGTIQNLIHSLKYKGVKEVGEELGKHLGSELNSSIFSDIDLIIPIPLHKKRQKFRGYNQSEWIAKGISEIMNKPIDIKSVIRATYTETQTKKNKDERWENVKNIFEIKLPENLENKHVLLVDDVITTGSTIESCAKTILEVNNVKISIAAIAFVSN